MNKEVDGNIEERNMFKKKEVDMMTVEGNKIQKKIREVNVWSFISIPVYVSYMVRYLITGSNLPLVYVSLP